MSRTDSSFGRNGNDGDGFVRNRDDDRISMYRHNEPVHSHTLIINDCSFLLLPFITSHKATATPMATTTAADTNEYHNCSRNALPSSCCTPYADWI